MVREGSEKNSQQEQRHIWQTAVPSAAISVAGRGRRVEGGRKGPRDDSPGAFAAA